MPRATKPGVVSALEKIRKQAGDLLAVLRAEIRAVETNLQRLRNEEAQLAGFAGRSGARVAAKPSGTRGRINWGTVLEQMPKQFKAADVRKVRAVSNKRSSEIFAGISRWLQSGEVKKKERGLYERLK